MREHVKTFPEFLATLKAGKKILNKPTPARAIYLAWRAAVRDGLTYIVQPTAYRWAVFAEGRYALPYGGMHYRVTANAIKQVTYSLE